MGLACWSANQVALGALGALGVLGGLRALATAARLRAEKKPGVLCRPYVCAHARGLQMPADTGKLKKHITIVCDRFSKGARVNKKKDAGSEGAVPGSGGGPAGGDASRMAKK